MERHQPEQKAEGDQSRHSNPNHEYSPMNTHQLQQQLHLQQMQFMQMQAQAQSQPHPLPQPQPLSAEGMPSALQMPLPMPFYPHPPAISSSSSISSLHHSAPTSQSHSSLPRAPLNLKDRVAYANLVAHHAALRRATPAVETWSNASAHAQLARNHHAAVHRNMALKQAAIDRQNSQMVSKITETVTKARSPYGYKPDPHTASHPRSLNFTRRKKEQARIAAANLQLAKRIIEKKAEIGGKSEWARHAAKHDRLHQNLSRYMELPPNVTGTPSHSYHPHQPPLPILSPNAIPPLMTNQQYMEAMQQLTHYQQQLLHPTPPSHSHSHRHVTPPTGPLHPLPDADKRSARLTSKMIAIEKERFAPSSKTERLLRPLRHQSTYPHPSNHAISTATSQSASHSPLYQSTMPVPYQPSTPPSVEQVSSPITVQTKSSSLQSSSSSSAHPSGLNLNTDAPAHATADANPISDPSHPPVSDASSTYEKENPSTEMSSSLTHHLDQLQIDESANLI